MCRFTFINLPEHTSADTHPLCGNVVAGHRATDGMALTALATILAIVHPQIGARWASKETYPRERILQARYYVGVALIVIGTLMQMAG
jgi:hypothetical protein